MQQSRRQAGVPVVAMDDIGLESVELAGADIGGNAVERREALPVVGPVATARRQIGIARAVEEVRRVEHDEVEAGGGPGDKRRLAAEEAGVFVQHLGLGQRRGDRRVARHQHPHLDAMGPERGGKRAHDIGEAAGLDQRKNLGGDGQDLHCPDV